MILDSRTLQSTPESGGRAGYDGAKRRKGSKVHAAVETLGNLLALLVTPANEQDRAQVGELAQAVQDLTSQSVELACVDQGRATPATTRLRKPKRTAFSWKSSNCPKPNAALSCCRGDGSWNARSRGQPGSVGWCVSTSGFLPLWRACT